MLKLINKLNKTKKKMSNYSRDIFIDCNFFSDLIMPYSHEDISHTPLLKPSTRHLLGTDEIGHDIFFLY